MKDDGEIIEKEQNKLDKKQLGECEFGSLKMRMHMYRLLSDLFEI